MFFLVSKPAYPPAGSEQKQKGWWRRCRWGPIFTKRVELLGWGWTTELRLVFVCLYIFFGGSWGFKGLLNWWFCWKIICARFFCLTTNENAKTINWGGSLQNMGISSRFEGNVFNNIIIFQVRLSNSFLGMSLHGKVSPPKIPSMGEKVFSPSAPFFCNNLGWLEKRRRTRWAKHVLGWLPVGAQGWHRCRAWGEKSLEGVGGVLHRKPAESEASWSGVSMLGESNHRNACYFRVVWPSFLDSLVGNIMVMTAGFWGNPGDPRFFFLTKIVGERKACVVIYEVNNEGFKINHVSPKKLQRRLPPCRSTKKTGCRRKTSFWRFFWMLHALKWCSFFLMFVCFGGVDPKISSVRFHKGSNSNF